MMARAERVEKVPGTGAGLGTGRSGMSASLGLVESSYYSGHCHITANITGRIWNHPDYGLNVLDLSMNVLAL